MVSYEYIFYFENIPFVSANTLIILPNFSYNTGGPIIISYNWFDYDDNSILDGVSGNTINTANNYSGIYAIVTIDTNYITYIHSYNLTENNMYNMLLASV